MSCKHYWIKTNYITFIQPKRGFRRRHKKKRGGNDIVVKELLHLGFYIILCRGQRRRTNRGGCGRCRTSPPIPNSTPSDYVVLITIKFNSLSPRIRFPQQVFLFPLIPFQFHSIPTLFLHDRVFPACFTHSRAALA